VKFGGNELHPRLPDRLCQWVTSFDESMGPVAYGEQIRAGDELAPKYLLPNYVDLAFAVQDRLEQALTSLVKRLLRETGLQHLAMAGGVAMNCKANSTVASLAGAEHIFIHPASSDDGACLGAAFYVSRASGENPRNTLHHAQLGPCFSNDEVEQVLQRCNLDYSTPPDATQAASDMIRDGKVLGWFHGGVEMGARALGGRSIIAAPHKREVVQRLNRTIKRRELWRPFCPSITSEAKNVYLQDAVEAPFMILARLASQSLSEYAPATVHVDGTARPQTVERTALPRWHHLLECVKSWSGHPVVLNTSLNVSDEPIVCTPMDAIRCFYSTGLDAIILEDFVLVK